MKKQSGTRGAGFYLFVILCIALYSCVTPGGAKRGVPPVLAGKKKQEVFTDYLKSIITGGLEHPDPAVQARAIDMAVYLGDNTLYDTLLPLYHQGPGEKFDSYKFPLVNTLYTMEPDRTVKLLVSYNDYTLENFGLFELFSLIGYDKIPFFDNLFYNMGISSGRQNILTGPMVLGRMLLATGDRKYSDALVFYDYGGFGPGELFFLYNYFKANGLPLKKIILTLRYKAGNLGTEARGVLKSGKSPGLTDILFQSLLYRLNLADTVYNKEIVYKAVDITDTAVEKYGFNVVRFTDDGDLSHFTFSPYFPLLDAVAHFYAGVPGERHYNILVNSFYYYEESPLRFSIAGALLESPENRFKEKVVRFFAGSPDPAVRRIVFRYFTKAGQGRAPEYLSRSFEEEEVALNRILLTEILGMEPNNNNAELLKSLLEDNNPLVSVTAAGMLLRKIRGSEGFF